MLFGFLQPVIKRIRLSGRITSVSLLTNGSENGSGPHLSNGNGQAAATAAVAMDRCPPPEVRFPLQRKLIAGDVIEPDDAAAVAHMERCPRCVEELDTLRVVGLHYVDSGSRYRPDDD